jgi:hypothetical protein
VIVDSSSSDPEADDVISSDSEERGASSTVLVAPRGKPSAFQYKVSCGGFGGGGLRFDTATPTYLTIRSEVLKDLYSGKSTLVKATTVSGLWQSRRTCAESPFERPWEF